MFKKRAGRLALVAVAFVLTACNGLVIDQRAVYTSSPSQEITGSFTVADGDSLVSVTVNGTPATVNGDRYSATLPLDGAKIFNNVVVEATFGSGEKIRDRRTVVYGDGSHATVVGQGAHQPNSTTMRINDSALAKLGPRIQELAPIDPAKLAPPGTVVIDRCVQRGIFTCWVWLKATIGDPPTLQGISAAADSQPNQLHGVITLDHLGLDLNVNAKVFGVPTPCGLRVGANTTTIDANYTGQPDPADNHVVDVNQVGAQSVAYQGFTSDFVDGLCSVIGIEQFIGLIFDATGNSIKSQVTLALGDPDGAGPRDSLVADAIEGAIKEVRQQNPVGHALGMNIDSILTSIDEDADGISVRATSAFAPESVAPDTPNLTGSVSWGDQIQALPKVTPGGLPYDFAIGASASGVNQLLMAETERGLLNANITHIGGTQLTTNLLIALLGGLPLLEDHPVRLELRPEIAPVVDPGPAPAGGLGQFRLSGYRVTVKASDLDAILAVFVIDFSTPASLVYANDELAFSLVPPGPENLKATVTQNILGVPDSAIEPFVQTAAPLVFQAVSDELPAFPVPQLGGASVQFVEIARHGSGYVLYGNLAL